MAYLRTWIVRKINVDERTQRIKFTHFTSEQTENTSNVTYCLIPNLLAGVNVNFVILEVFSLFAIAVFR